MQEFINEGNVWKITATCPHGYLEKILLDTRSGALMIPRNCVHTSKMEQAKERPISRREQRRLLREFKKL